MKCPALRCLTLPRSMTAITPSANAGIPIKRVPVPKPGMVIASSHGIANTKSQRKANASLPIVEQFSAPTEKLADQSLSCLGLRASTGMPDRNSNVRRCAESLIIFLVERVVRGCFAARLKKRNWVRNGQHDDHCLTQSSWFEVFGFLINVSREEHERLNGPTTKRHTCPTLSAGTPCCVRVPINKIMKLPASCTIAATNMERIAPRSPCRGTRK